MNFYAVSNRDAVSNIDDGKMDRLEARLYQQNENNASPM